MTVFVYYQRGSNTGGPEALHQLVHELNGLDVPAALVPLPGTEDRQEVESFESYGCPMAGEVQDTLDSVVVAPETGLAALSRVRRAQRVIWWLSIDNAHLFKVSRLRARRQPMTRVIGTQFEESTAFLVGRRATKRRQRHLLRSSVNCTQSAYAWAYIYSRFNIVPSMLSDYISSAVPTSLPPDDRGGDARPIIAYNPRRGSDFYPDLVELRPDWRWQPIQGMSREEVTRTLQGSTIYLDLGHQPGKDRLPREAALAGAVVVMAREGAGAYFEDTPLPWKYKVDLSAGRTSVVDNTARLLESILADVDRARDEQVALIEFIRGERVRFRSEVEAIFKLHHLGSDVPGFR